MLTIPLGKMGDFFFTRTKKKKLCYSINVKYESKFLTYIMFRDLFLAFFSMKIQPSIHLVSCILSHCFNRIKILGK